MLLGDLWVCTMRDAVVFVDVLLQNSILPYVHIHSFVDLSLYVDLLCALTVRHHNCFCLMYVCIDRTHNHNILRKVESKPILQVNYRIIINVYLGKNQMYYSILSQNKMVKHIYNVCIENNRKIFFNSHFSLELSGNCQYYHQ